MNIYRLAVNRPIFIIMMFLALATLAGFVAGKIGIDLMPRISLPVAAVTTVYRGAGPEEIEASVTKAIEDAVGSVGRIESISSISADNASTVIIEFEYGTDMDAAMADVRDRADRTVFLLPEAADKPIIARADPSDMPVIYLAVSGPQTGAALWTLADQTVRREVEKLAGVASVSMRGGVERDILVTVDPPRLEACGLSVQQVVGALAAENLNVPTGRITAPELEYDVRLVGQFQTVDEIADIMVGIQGGAPVYLRDVATVRDAEREQRIIVRVNGEECVVLEVRKNTDANSVAVCQLVRDAADNLNAGRLGGVKLSIVLDQSDFIMNSVVGTRDTAIEAALLAALIILLFLGSLRSTFIAAISIPVSIMGAFLLFYFNHMTLNLVTLSALTMAIGRVVDDSIVVLENVFRHVEGGAQPMEAACEGTQEVALPVFASTFTTVAVFLPLFLVTGMVGQFFKPLAATFIFALVMSTFVAITLVPTLASKLLRAHRPAPADSGSAGALARARRAWHRLWDAFVRAYRGALRWSLAHRLLVLLIAFGSLAASLLIVPIVGTEFIPAMDMGYAMISVETPLGTSLRRTEDVVRQVEEIVSREVPEAEYTMGVVGYTAGLAIGGEAGGIESGRIGAVAIKLVDRKERRRSSFAIKDALRPHFTSIPSANIRVQELWSLTGKRPLEVIIKGRDLETLAELGEEALDRISKVPGVADPDINWRSGTPEYHIALDRPKAAYYGLNAAQVGMSLRALLHGQDATKFREYGEEYDITVRMPESERSEIESLTRCKLLSPLGIRVPLTDIATITLGGGPSTISRKDRSRSVIIQSDIRGRPLGDIVKDVDKELHAVSLPPGYTYEYGGESKEQEKSFRSLFAALALGIALMYFVLASQFESLVHPLTIMAAIPVEVVGALVASLLAGTPISVSSLMGVIMLTGIVVANAILLVNQIIIHRRAGMERGEAIIEAGAVRIRPVLMTALATIAAMTPVALGLREGGEFFQPLGQVVLGGLISSTALTLLLVPVMYTILDDIGKRFASSTSAQRPSDSPTLGATPKL